MDGTNRATVAVLMCSCLVLSYLLVGAAVFSGAYAGWGVAAAVFGVLGLTLMSALWRQEQQYYADMFRAFK
jgi:hypothetical protein